MSDTLAKILQNLQAIEHMNLLITEQGLTEAIRKLQPGKLTDC
jgi:hypothetical protein